MMFSLKKIQFAVHKYEPNYVKEASQCLLSLLLSSAWQFIWARGANGVASPSADDDEANEASDEPVVVLKPYI